MELLAEKSIAVLIVRTLIAAPTALEAGEEEVCQAGEITVTGTRPPRDRGVGEDYETVVGFSMPGRKVYGSVGLSF